MLWYRLVGQVFVPDSQPICSSLAHVCRTDAHVLRHSSSLVDGLATGNPCGTHKADLLRLGQCHELTKVETWWYGDDSPHLADSV